MKRFNIAISKDDGGIEVYPMKEWLRQHPDETPSRLDPTSSTSHQIRDALRKAGWSIKETDTQVLLMKPSGGDDTATIDQVLGTTEEDPDESDPADVSFSLEYQLRDFLAQNLSAIAVGGRRLKLYVDPTGRDGIEYPSAVGPIDLLAVDENGWAAPSSDLLDQLHLRAVGRGNPAHMPTVVDALF
jgi:endonuclease